MPRLRHLAIVTSNRERMVKFYTVAFGMRVIYARRGATHLSDGEFNFAIRDKSGNLKEGLCVIGFDVDDTKDISDALKEAGAPSDPAHMPKEHDAEYRVPDPDGNLIDLSIHGWPLV
jgi:catechol 2,3-dioxygenase-like lactoylglutathione lyase family enzyme